MRLNKSATLFAGVFVAASLTTSPASAAAASTPAAAVQSMDIPGLHIGPIGYNAYGPDDHDKLNAEYVDVVSDAAAGVNVAGLLLQDAWARGNNRTSRCNTFTLNAGVLPVEAGATVDVLPAGRTLRIYMGAGTPRVVARGGVTYHAVYANSSTRCGYNGHIFNNGAGGNRFAPWDTAWITLGGVSESKGYNFSFGYVAT